MHRALLIFVSRYSSEKWVDLNFLDNEYTGIRQTLTDHGYEIHPESCGGEVRAANISLKIENFIGDACAGDELLVYLSGHGFYYDDSHWFAASDSNLDAGEQTMRVTNMPLDKGWPASVARSRAADVLFVVDACRDRLVPSHGYQTPSFPPEGSGQLNYLMACEPEKPAVFLESSQEPGERYSLFTQAFRNVLADFDGYLTADRCRDLLEVEMEDLRSRRDLHVIPQIPRLSGEEGAPRFQVLFDREIQEWEASSWVGQHNAWSRAKSGFAKDQMIRETVIAVSNIASMMSHEKGLLTEDPWIDWNAHRRASRHCVDLLERLSEDFSLNHLEAALLVLGHQLYQGFRVRLARNVDQDLKRSFTNAEIRSNSWAQYPRLQRLTNTSVDPSRGRRDRRVVEAWVLHQDLANPGDSHKHEDELLAYLDSALSGTDDLAEALAPDLIAWLFRAMQRGGSALAEPPALSGSREMRIRYQVVGYLLATSQIMSLDICELPSVLVEHIGGRNRINFGEVRRGITGARWQAIGRTLRLEAECDHQAIMVALQERADSLDGLLYMASNVTGLEAMPNRASGDGAAPVEDQVTKKGKFLPVATRFGLDGTRVRDLLAGEQLYTDRSLAIRELYQNALDACNVRQARELWNPGLATDNSWQGKIEIRQQMYGSRQVVECIDNGSGMGRGELLHAFAQGGVRLSHLSEFQEEKLQWRKKRIPFHENSRFGIGVLSYFMIADEIEVITRKFHRDRHAGTILKVVISGPDHLFHVEEEVYDAQFGGDECGTILRCYLRSDLVDFSSVQALRSVLGVAQFKTVAKHGVECETWEPGIYRRRVNVHGVNPIDGSGDIVRDPEGEVFWCEYDGSLLIDGIHAESIWINPEGKPIESRGNGTMRVPGAVVNLVGPVVVAEGREKSTPRLTVDRSKVIDDVFVPILKRLRAATASLSDAGFLDYRWLGRATRREPRLADVIVQGLIDQNASLSYDDGSVSMAQIGYMPGDEVFRTFWRHPSPHAKIKPTRIEGGSLPDHIALWRYMAHFREEVASALGELLPSDWQNRNLRPALPSDSVVLGLAMDSDGGIRGHTVTTLEKLPQYAAKLHEELPTTIGRLQELNLQMAGSFELLDMQTITSYTSSLSSGLMGSAFGLVAVMKDRRVHAGWFMRVCDEMQTSTSKLGEYLRHIGYDLQYCSRLLDPDAPGHGEAISLISERFDGRSPWYAAEKLSSSRVLQAAARLNMSVEAVRTAYARLGILPPQFERNRGSDLDGLLLLGLGSRASEKSCALIPDVLRACLVTGEEPASVVQRAAALGIAVDGEPPEKLPTYASLLQVPVSDRDPVDAHRPISLPEIKAIHERTGMAMQLIADQLRELGVCVPFREIPNRLDSEDERLLAQGVRSYGMRVWLDPARVVPRAHVLLAAASLRKSPDEIVQRLLGLGMQVDPLPSDLPYSGIERRAIDSWIPYDGPRIVPLGCVLQVAIDSKCTVPEAVAILRAYGLTVQDIPAGMVEVSSEDHLLFTSVRPERISFSRRLSTVEVVARARATDVTVEIVRRRLLELGAKIPSARDFRRHAYGDDDLFRGFPAELDPIPAAYVLLKADGMGLALIEIIDRLVAAGVSIQEFDFGPIERPGWEDLTMLRNNGSPSGAEISLVRPVSLEHLLICAHRMNLTVGDVAERLGQLGLKVGDVGKMIDDAWKMVPKIP